MAEITPHTATTKWAQKGGARNKDIRARKRKRDEKDAAERDDFLSNVAAKYGDRGATLSALYGK